MTETHNEESWIKIPGVPERYEISDSGRVRVWYKYLGHDYKPHYEFLRPDGNVVRILDKKYNVSRLLQQLFGKSFCEDIPGEEWVDVRGYEDLYQVSTYGRVKSKSNNIVRSNGVIQFNQERIIKFCLINSGYYRVMLHKDKQTKGFLVHRLVAEHFIPNPKEYKEVNHKDEKKTNNYVDNLEWCDKVYNANYGTTQERRIRTRLKNNNGKYGVPRRNTRSAGV